MLTPYRDLINNRYFKFIWLSQIFSQITVNILNFILLVVLFEKTNSSIAASLLWVSYALPAIFFGPIAATTVDLLNKRKILIITNFLQGLLVLAYSLLHEEFLFLTYFIVVCYSFLNQFYLPSEAATLPTVLKKRDLAFANSLFFITQQLSLVLGFGISGFLLRFLGFRQSLVLCSLMLFFAFVSSLLLPDMPGIKIGKKNLSESLVEFFTTINEGYKFIKNEKFVLGPTLVIIFSQVSLSVVMVNVPSFARGILGITPDKAGHLVVVPASLGALLGGLFVPKLIREGVRKIVIIKKSFLTIVLCLTLITILIPILSYITRILVSIFLIISVGFSFMAIVVSSQTFLQEFTPTRFRGRVFGNLWFIITVASIFPVLVSGTIAELLGIKALFIFLTIVFALGYWYISGSRFSNTGRGDKI